MIKKDFDFVMRVLKHKDNKHLHLPALRNLINNFKKNWDDTLGQGVADFYVKQLNKIYTDGI